MVYQNILQAIGNTPIVKLNRVVDGLQADVYAKLEFMNPGGSVKDRLGWWLVEDAEKRGVLKPGGTIVEGTSGNTGVGLAIAAAIKGYKCVFVLPDKMSEEKIKNLRAFGAKVVVTPTAVEPEDPRSYYSVSKRLAQETGGFYANQYDNLANRECHYNMTGPEIFKQMPDIDVFVAGIGTGGTICGVGKYLKEKRPGVQIVAVDPIGSIVYHHFKTGKLDIPALPYKIEGIGEDFIPKNYDYKTIDDMIQVEDKESFLMTRSLLKREGMYIGISSGSAVVGAIRWIKEQGARLKGKKVLVLLPDSGNRYLSKVYDDDWMREAGFLETESMGKVQDLLHSLVDKPSQVIMVKQEDKISSIIELMKEKDISQVPVADADGRIRGVAKEDSVLKALYRGQAKLTDKVSQIMDSSVEFAYLDDPVERASALLTQGKIPLVVDRKHPDRVLTILTHIDLLSFMGR